MDSGIDAAIRIGRNPEMTSLNAARRSTRRFNVATDAQRAGWKDAVRAILTDAGMDAFQISCALDRGDWDGMDTPSMAARSILADRG